MNNNELQALADMISANVALNTKAVLTVDECARFLGLTKSYVYKLTHRHLIPCSKPLGKCVYFDRQELEKWLLSNRQSTVDEINDKALSYCAHTRTFSKNSKKKGGAK